MAPVLVVHNVTFPASVKFISRQEGDLFSESCVFQALWGVFEGLWWRNGSREGYLQ